MQVFVSHHHHDHHHRSPFISSFSLVLALFGSIAGLAVPRDASAQYSLISVAMDGNAGNALSEGPSVSADGRFVAFSSRAANLVANDTNNSYDVFVRDRQANTTTRVSVTSAGEERAGDSRFAKISANGRFVVFQSGAPLVADDTNMCQSAGPTCEDVYVHDRQTGTTTRVSVSTGGAQGIQHSSFPSMSADARFIVFGSFSSNLVDNDTNATGDIFLRDTQTNTTSRVSLTTAGIQNPARSIFGLISADARIITFASTIPSTDFPNPQPCVDNAACPATFIYDRENQTVSLLSSALPPVAVAPFGQLDGEEPVAISADGRVVVLEQRDFSEPYFRSRRSLVLDRQTGRVTVGRSQMFNPPSSGFGTQFTGISPDGRYVYRPSFSPVFHLDDRVSGRQEPAPAPTPPSDVAGGSGNGFSADNRFLAFDTPSQMVPSDTNSVSDVYLIDRDVDSDAVPGDWETIFGTDPATFDATLDPDGDGLNNLQEYQAGTHPNGVFKRYLAEGAVNAFFSTTLAAMNPNEQPASVLFHFQGATGRNSGLYRALEGRTRATLDLVANRDVPEDTFSTVIESSRPIVVDRTMRWDQNFFGAHAETAIESPATTWYLAEGATHGNFDLFYLLQNPGDTSAQVNVRYLLLPPATPIAKPYTVPPRSRLTIYVDTEGPGLDAADMGAVITSDQPIIVERAMYASAAGVPFAAGHGSAGLTAPAPRWFLAEGATGSFFDLYLLVANPNTSASEVDVTYLLPNDPSFTKRYSVGPEGRLTISVDGEDPRLADTPVSVIVETVNNQPVVVERAMWWPSPNWYESHVSAGSTTTGTRWGLAEGRATNGDVIGQIPVETYVLIANTSPTAGSAKLTLVGETGVVLEHTVSLPANSRVSVPISPLIGSNVMRSFGTIVESDGVEIVVERAMYWNTNGVTWAAGTAALATKLQ